MRSLNNTSQPPAWGKEEGGGGRECRFGWLLLSCLLLLPVLSLTGCDRSDPIVLIQLHPKNPDIIYVATNDYIYKSRDRGQTWMNLSKGMSHSRVIAMAVDPVYPATVYAGTKGDAVYKSHDGGQRWVSMRTGLDDATISSVVNQFVFDPLDSNHIFLATTMGVFETKNGGENWTKRMDGMKEVLMVVSLGMDPTRPSILYAGTSGGVYKSADQAGHWDKVNRGLVPEEMVKTSRALNVTAIQVDPFEPDTVYAATLTGLYKTTDGAKSWQRIGETLADQMFIAMVLDRSRKGVVYITGRDGVHRSEDGGATWKTLNNGFTTTNVRSIAQSATDPKLFYAGTNGSGLYRSLNAGETWEPVPALSNMAVSR
ncbi:WD40/YVTN/BNR-like repeat-containing protein [Petrachloros mirabilis]